MSRSRSGPGRSYRECISLEGLFELFGTEENAAEWFGDTRWGDLRYCPHCGSMDTLVRENKKPMSYRRRDCCKCFSIRTKTPMAQMKEIVARMVGKRLMYKGFDWMIDSEYRTYSFE